jgi:hypothetical protein
MVKSVRKVIGRKKTIERRYSISSLGAQAQQALRAMRRHWAVENELHGCLDIGLNLLKQEKSCRLGIKSKRKKAGWDESYLLKVLKM